MCERTLTSRLVLPVFSQVFSESSYGSREVNFVTLFNRHAFEFLWLFLLRKSNFYLVETFKAGNVDFLVVAEHSLYLEEKLVYDIALTYGNQQCFAVVFLNIKSNSFEP